MLQLRRGVLVVLSQSIGASAFSGGLFISTTHLRRSSRGAVRMWSDVPVGGCDDSVTVRSYQTSHIVSVKSHNIAGIANDTGSSDIEIDFGSAPCLVAITGESGTGKSLLVSKALDVVTGGKATNSLVQDPDMESWIELTVRLCEPHLSAVSSALQHFGIDPLILYQQRTEETTDVNGYAVGYLHLQRTLIGGAGKLKSICRINEKHVSLKTLREIASPLFTRVDVGVASGALARAASRLAMIDIGVEDFLKKKCIQSRDAYKEATKRKIKIKKELESRILPSSMQGNTFGYELEQEQIELLEHWVDELDIFESRVKRFQEAIYEQYSEHLAAGNEAGSNNVMSTVQKFRQCVWGDHNNEDDTILAHLLQFREGIKAVESQLIAANAAYEGLTSLTAPESAAVSLERVRKLLYSISSDGPLFEKVERAHELLNVVEESLNDCARSIDGDSNSIITTLENAVCAGVSMEEIDGLIADWNALARKHGISPYVLPTCHTSMRQELDGNVEVLKLLPEAEEDERVAQADYAQACKELSSARELVASNLSRSVTELLPSLGLECTFQVRLAQRPGGFDDPYCGSETLGVDVADLLIFHNKVNGVSNESRRGGYIEQVGSSGEKSRVLLAIETCLPGSIGATCNEYSSEYIQNQKSPQNSPISIVYDEIDAHVGGRAAVTIAKLLADQSSKSSEAGTQIIAITHSASVAAIADRHIVIERGSSSGSTSPTVRASVVDGSSRRKEIARMASGDLAVGEAETFADALIRDALLHRDA